MCGILGSINLPFAIGTLDKLRHRGPDDEGIDEVSLGSHKVIIGHRRLSIVDLSTAGHQPMWSIDGQFGIVYNGEVYNHLALRHELSDTVFRGTSDTETILEYFSRLGVSGVRKFNGIFAFVIIDMVSKKLILARDPFGVKPLYFSSNNNTFVFSSEIKPILEITSARLDLDHLAELLRMRFLPSPDTLFRNICKIRPGHILEVDCSKPEISFSEFSYVCATSKQQSLPFDSTIRQYGMLLEQAVQRQLMSDVEVGVLLSGGVDSAVLAAFAQRHSTYRLKAFTVGYDHYDKADETTDASETAALLNLDHRIVRMKFDQYIRTLSECIRVVEEPLATTSLVPMYYLAQLAGSMVKVVLSGQGADEVLGGYGRYQAELYSKIVPCRLAQVLRKFVMKTGLKNDQLSRGLARFSEFNDVDGFLATYSVFHNADIDRLIGRSDVQSRERIGYFYDMLGCAELKNRVERMIALDLRMSLADDLLLYTDKLTMRFSLECRVPFLDHTLMGFIESLPSSYRVGLGEKKIIHRALAKTILPAFIVNRKKKGFLSPTATWFKRKPIRDLLLDPSSKLATHFNLREVNKIIEQHELGFNRDRHIFLLLSIRFWLEMFA